MALSTSLIFDIQSGSVGAAVMSYGEGKPKLLWADRIAVPVTPGLTMARLSATAIQALQKIAEEACLQGARNKVSTVFCFYGAPWHISHPLTISIEKKEPFTVTPLFLQSLLDKEEKEFVKNGWITMDKAVHSVDLNGYRVSNPYQKGVKKLSAAVFLSAAEKPFIQKVESVLYKYIHIREIKHTALPYATSSVIAEVLPHDRSVLCISLGEEITEVSIVRNGELQNTATFPTGKHTLLRNMLGKHDGAVGLSLTRLHLNNTGSPEWTSTISKHIEHARKTWSDNLNTTLQSLSVHTPLPKTVLLVGDPDARALFSQETALETPVFLSEEMLKGLIDISPLPIHDVFLATEGIFAQSLMKR